MVGYLREMISNWLEIMGNMIKKKNEMLHDEIPSYALSKILLVVVQNLCDFASLASVCYTGLWVPQVLCVSTVVPVIRLWASLLMRATVSVDLITEHLRSSSCDFTINNTTVLAFPSALTSSSPQFGTSFFPSRALSRPVTGWSSIFISD